MKIAIIGGGITGLSAAFELTQKGHAVHVFERSPFIGGLGTYKKIGTTYIEAYYHHFFETDYYIKEYAEKLGIGNKLKFYNTKTGIFIDRTLYPFNSPGDLLKFSPLSLLDRIRCGIIVAYLKYLPFIPVSLDAISATSWIKKYAGENVYKRIWGPLLEGKFSKYSSTVPALWLWGRVKDRSFKLGYFDGSVKVLLERLLLAIKKNGSQIETKAEVTSVESKKGKIHLVVNKKEYIFDKVIFTSLSPITTRLIKNTLPKAIRTKLEKIDHLGALCVILELEKPIQSQYWLNLCDKDAPVLVMVEQTNMIPAKKYGGHSIVYLANYLHASTTEFQENDKDVVKKYSDYLKIINKDFKKSWIKKAHVSRVPRAQTIFKINALKAKPSITLPIENMYMVNIDQMYPHDRNLNQGIELGKKVSSLISKEVAE